MAWGGKSRKRAFTLLELLVVVAIVGALVAILAPALRQARAQARQIVCLTNLRAQGEAAFHYAHVNQGYLVRGVICQSSAASIGQACDGEGVGSLHSALLEFLQPDDEPMPPQRLRDLWALGYPRQQSLDEVFASVPQYQCPERPLASNLHYVSNAMPIPYTIPNLTFDLAESRLVRRVNPVHVRNLDSSQHYVWASRDSEIASVANLSNLIYVTEAHRTIPLATPDMPAYYYYTFHLASHLPFSRFPAIADDRRHPTGVSGLYFDGHAATRSLRSLDPGAPATVGVRLRWFSPLSSDVPQSYW